MIYLNVLNMSQNPDKIEKNQNSSWLKNRRQLSRLINYYLGINFQMKL